jgi:tetratricopeptide (TPR) repeat protein
MRFFTRTNGVRPPVYIKGAILERSTIHQAMSTSLMSAAEERILLQRSPEKRIEQLLNECRAIQYSNPDAALVFAERAYAESKRFRLSEKELHSLRMHGICLYAAHRYTQALEIFEKGHRLSVRRKDRVGAMKAQQNIGQTLRRLGRATEALDAYNRALALAVPDVDTDVLKNLYTNIGSVLLSLNRPAEALASYSEALALVERHDDAPFVAYLTGNIADVYINLGDVENGVDWARKSLDIHRSTGDAYGMALALSNLGRAYNRKGDTDTSLSCYVECLGLMADINNEQGRGRTLLFMAKLYVSRGQYDRALECASAAATIFATLAEADYQADAACILADAYVQGGNVAAARTTLQRARSIVATSQNLSKHVDVLVALADVDLHVGKFSAAVTTLRKALALAETSESALSKAIVHEYLSDALSALNKHKDALAHSKLAFHFRQAEDARLHADHAQALKMRLDIERAARERERLDIEAHRMAHDLEVRSKELSASALALAQQNDLLSSIADAIRLALKQPTMAKTHLRSALLQIDKHQRHGEDRKHFEEQLAIVQEKFLSALAERCPGLSATERRLASLLRLGLASKEVADVMAISTKSVEVYRSRLRSKLSIDHSVSLVSYLNSLG